MEIWSVSWADAYAFEEIMSGNTCLKDDLGFEEATGEYMYITNWIR